MILNLLIHPKDLSSKFQWKKRWHNQSCMLFCFRADYGFVNLQLWVVFGPCGQGRCAPSPGGNASSSVHKLQLLMLPSPFWQLPDWWETQPSSRFLIPNVLFSIAWPFSEALDSFGRKIPKYTFVFYHDELVQWQQNVNRRWERLAGSFEIAALKCTVAWEMAHVWDKVGKGTDNSAKGSA